ncbi:MAG: type VI secretion system baseplate subunit TssK, partial [Bryobacteraceae bacterium]
MKRLQPVIWSKGTALAPQHLQIQDRFIENSLHFQIDALNFRPWGFQTLRIDQEAMAGGN